MADQAHEIQMLKEALDEALKTIERYELVATGLDPTGLAERGDPIMILANVYRDNAHLKKMVDELSRQNLTLTSEILELRLKLRQSSPSKDAGKNVSDASKWKTDEASDLLRLYKGDTSLYNTSGNVTLTLRNEFTSGSATTFPTGNAWNQFLIPVDEEDDDAEDIEDIGDQDDEDEGEDVDL